MIGVLIEKWLIQKYLSLFGFNNESKLYSHRTKVPLIFCREYFHSLALAVLAAWDFHRMNAHASILQEVW